MLQKNELSSVHDSFMAIEKNLTQLRIEEWLHHDLHSWQWWLLLIILFLPWFIWWKYVEKKRLIEITLLGMIVLIISSYLDAIITELGLWSYEFWLVPLWPCMIAADFTVLPVTLMVIYQTFPSWRNFVLVMTITAALFAFVGEPFLVWIDIYELHGWQHIYSFPIYLVIGVFAKYLVQTLTLRRDVNMKNQ